MRIINRDKNLFLYIIIISICSLATERIENMKNRIVLVFLSLMIILFGAQSTAYADNYFGTYEVNEDITTAVSEITLEDDYFELVIGRSNNGESDAYLEALMGLRDIINNSDILFGTVDPTSEENDPVSMNDPRSAIRFAEGDIFPSFKIQIFNPEYQTSNDILRVEFKSKPFIEFELTGEGELKDVEDGELIVVEE